MSLDDAQPWMPPVRRAATRLRAGAARVFSRDNELARAFLASRVAPAAFAILCFVAIATIFAGWVAPYDPYDLASIDLSEAQAPPAWISGGAWAHPLGTDEQGRDLLSALIHGARASLFVGLASVALAAGRGAAAGLAAGYRGGFVEAVAMRAADVQMTIPDIMMALLVNGLLRALLPRDLAAGAAATTIILAIGLANWPQYARVLRACAARERARDYVASAIVTGVGSTRIVLGHVLPNVAGPLCILVTQGVASAILAESALSFIGVGMPITKPSLGTLIRAGNAYMLSGEWWTLVFPAVTLSLIVFSINILGDWLKDTLNPRLK